MSNWSAYPDHYRIEEVKYILQAVCAGECVEIIGLSGSGKSNLLGFIANRIVPPRDSLSFVLVDCNLLTKPSAEEFYRLVIKSLEGETDQKEGFSVQADQLAQLSETIGKIIERGKGLCLLLDRFDIFIEEQDYQVIASNLRAIRDSYKYLLTYVVATRKLLDSGSELAELFFGNTTWIGPLSRDDALWSAKRDSQRFEHRGMDWSQDVLEQLINVSWGYPSLLRAVCEAYSRGASLDEESLRQHQAVTKRVDEFWSDAPDEDALRHSRLFGHPLIRGSPVKALLPVGTVEFDTTQLTSKEHLLLKYFMDHQGDVCEKDDLVRAVWPEDIIFERGIRDDSLAQLVRRLRVKIEPDPGNPLYIRTVPGRGYIFCS